MPNFAGFLPSKILSRFSPLTFLIFPISEILFPIILLFQISKDLSIHSSWICKRIFFTGDGKLTGATLFSASG